MSKCVVPGCFGRRGHTFPQDPIRQENWLKAVQWNRQEKPHRAAIVCHNHFKKTDYILHKERKILPGVKTRMRLKKTAVPSVFEHDYNSSASPKGVTSCVVDVSQFQLLLEIRDNENSPLLGEKGCINDELIITESDVNGSTSNVLDSSSSDEDIELSSLSETIRSKLFADNEESTSIFVPSGEGTLEFTTKSPTKHPVDYDSDDGFISISRNFEDGNNDGLDSDIIIPLKNQSLASEPDKECSVGSEPTCTPNVTDIIVYDADDEEKRNVNSLLLAQIIGEEKMQSAIPNHIDTRPIVTITNDSLNEDLIQHQTESTKKRIINLNPLSQALKASQPLFTKISNSTKLISEIKRTLPKVRVNTRKVMVIRKSSSLPKFVSPMTFIPKGIDVCRKQKLLCESSLKHPTNGSNLVVKTLSLSIKEFQRTEMEKKKDQRFICITKQSKEDNNKVEEEEHNLSIGKKGPSAVSETELPSPGDDNSEPKSRDVRGCDDSSGKRIESDLYDEDDDSSLDLRISSDEGCSDDVSELDDMAEREDKRKSYPSNAADSATKELAADSLTINVDSDDETGNDKMHSPNQGGLSKLRAAESTIIVVGPSGILDSDDLAGNDVEINSDALHNSESYSLLSTSDNDSVYSNSSGEIRSVSGDEEDSIGIDLDGDQLTTGSVYNVVTKNDRASDIYILVIDKPDDKDSAAKLVLNSTLDQDMDPTETADGLISPSADTDVETFNVLDDDAQQRMDYAAGGENQAAPGDDRKWEYFSITDSGSTLTDPECYEGLIEENCLQFEVVENDSEMVLEDFNYVTPDPIAADPTIIDPLQSSESDALQPSRTSGIPCLVPDHMLVTVRGRTKKSKLRIPPPLILPDHDYTREVVKPNCKRRKHQRNYIEEGLELKECSVVLKRLNPSMLAPPPVSESGDEIEEFTNVPPNPSPPPLRNICFRCSIVFSSKELLCTHITYNHTESMFRCPHCSDKFTSVSKCNEHIGICDYIVESAPSRSTFLCPQCDFSTKDDSELRGHIDTEHRVKCSYFCPTCPFKCVSEIALQNHAKRYHASSQSRPVVKTSPNGQLTSSLYTVTESTNQQTFICPECQMEFKNPFLLQNHVSQCRNVLMQHACNLCRFSAQNAADLSWHFQTNHHGRVVHPEFKQNSSTIVQKAAAMLKKVTNIVPITSSIVQAQNAHNIVGQTSNVRWPLPRTNFPQPINSNRFQPIDTHPHARLMLQTSDPLRPQGISAQRPKACVLLPQVVQSGCTIRQPRIQPSNVTPQGKTRIKCIFPATPKNQFVQLTPVHLTPPLTTKTENLPVTEIDLTDDSADCGIVSPECKETIADYADPPLHLNNRSDEQFSCPYCKKPYRTQRGLKIHTNRCPLLRLTTVKCPECSCILKRFEINHHMVNKHRSTCFICEKCNFVSTVDAVMRLHRIVVHNMFPESGFLSCPICPQHTTNFTTIKSLRFHAQQRHFFLYQTTTKKVKNPT